MSLTAKDIEKALSKEVKKRSHRVTKDMIEMCKKRSRQLLEDNPVLSEDHLDSIIDGEAEDIIWGGR